MLDKINSKMSIGARLALVSGVFVASSAVVTSLLVGNATTQIDFSKKEGAGADYLTEVWSAVRGAGQLDQAGAEGFGASAAAATFAAAQTDLDRVNAGLALITAVADGSNLTLDPDLDSFYAMDAATVKLPALLSAALELERVVATTSADRDIMLTVAANRLDGAAAAAAGSMEAAIANNASGETRQALSESISTLKASAAELISAARSAAPGAELGAADAAFVATTDATWRATAEELSRMLDVRIANKQSELAMQLALVALFLAVAGVMALLVSKGLVGRIRALTATMDRLREGDFKVEVPYTGDGHETGKIASTLEVLRDGLQQRTEADARRLEEAQLGSEGYVKAISRAQAMIEFKPDGTITSANENFLGAMGYTATEIVGQHHSMFAPPDYARSPEYHAFWAKLNRGEFGADKFLYLGKGGREVWIQASYNPIVDKTGKTVKVVEFAIDITEQEKLAQESMFKSAAFAGSSSAMMMVDRDLKVTYINESTLKLLRDNAAAFRAIWPNFNPETIVGTCIDIFHKNAAHQRQLLSDPSRLPYKTDITIGELKIELNVSAVYDAQRRYAGNVLQWEDVTAARSNAGVLSALDRAKALIEFDLDGKILTANQNFCRTMGYTLDEIRGEHHSVFVDPAHRQSAEYRAFWERLNRGECDFGKYQRFGKGGREIWIEASYNPILDGNGKPFKVVELADDVTRIEADRKAGEAELATRAAEQNTVVTSLASGLRQLAEGNLTTRIAATFASDYEQLRTDFNDAMGTIQDAMGAIGGNAGGIRTGAGEIAQSADDLSRRTEQQAASLEETAAALDQITATVKKTSDGAKQANQVVQTARSDAESSGQVVRETVAAMAEIEKSSKQISQIIGVIDEIAFQTNLLALNAGVEAARAGEAGRGFAVVASEVRALAQRSSAAAKEIKDLISASSQHVKTGVDLVGEAGKALQVIAGKVGEISSLVGEIAASAQEQSTALVEVNTAINQMDQVTQQNAAMVEETTAASHTLRQDADGLMELIARFRTDAAPQARETHRAPPRGQPVAQQRQRVAKFAAGAAAAKTDDWQEF